MSEISDEQRAQLEELSDLTGEVVPDDLDGASARQLIGELRDRADHGVEPSLGE